MFIHVLKTFKALQCHMCGKYFMRTREIAKHIGEKANAYFGSQSNISNFRHLLQNPKVPKNIMGFSNHAQRFTAPNDLDVDSPLTNLFF